MVYTCTGRYPSTLIMLLILNRQTHRQTDTVTAINVFRLYVVLYRRLPGLYDGLKYKYHTYKQVFAIKVESCQKS